jgi:hypothetical protein
LGVSWHSTTANIAATRKAIPRAGDRQVAGASG